MKRLLLLITLLLCVSYTLAHALDEAQERRVRTGMRLFRVILAADEDILSKTNEDGKLSLWVVYGADLKQAEDFAEELKELGKGDDKGNIRKVPIEIKITNDLSFDTSPKSPPAGIFIVENLYDDAITRLVNYGISNHVIVYSPFEGDIDKGVLAGLAIETRVRPYINMQTMRDSKIRIKEFFLKVAKRYEP